MRYRIGLAEQMVARIERTKSGCSSSPQRKVHVHAIKAKLDPAACSPVQQATIKHGMNVAVHRLDVAADMPRSRANRHWTATGHRLQQLPTFGGENLPKQFRRREADARL